MDLNTIDDIKELKSMAYDQLATLEQTQKNLQAINVRINQVQGSQSFPPEMPEEAKANMAALREANARPEAPQNESGEPKVDKAQAVTS